MYLAHGLAGLRPMEIEVVQLSGNTISLQVPPESTVRSLKDL